MRGRTIHRCRRLVWPGLLLALAFGGCADAPEPTSPTATVAATEPVPIAPTRVVTEPVATITVATATVAAEAPSAATPLPVATPLILQPGDPVPPELLDAAEAAWGPGGAYVALLPRPNDVPTGWLPARSPRFEARTPNPGQTYRFACRDLPARSTGVATVGYRHLEGLPSIAVEYVVYASAEEASAAIQDMQTAAESCGSFTVSVDGLSGEVVARMTPLPVEPAGDASFASVLETSSESAGDTTTHVIKILRDNVVIGINHAVLAAETPDSAVSSQIARLALLYLEQAD